MATLRRFLQWIRVPGLLGFFAGSAVIAYGSLGYFDDEDVPAFVIEKLPLPMEELWMFALKAHVVAAAFCLPACLVLLSATLMKKAPKVHRWLGRTAGVAVLFALVPSGFYLSLFAKGGLPSTAGFMLSGLIVAVAMVQGVRTARSKNFVAHRRMMMHVAAQLSVAVSSRVMLYAFDAANFDADAAYLISLWVPVIASALFVEFLASPRRQNENVRAPRHVFARHARVGV